MLLLEFIWNINYFIYISILNCNVVIKNNYYISYNDINSIKEYN